VKNKFFDTSVLVPPFYGDHPHHESSILAIERLQAGEGFCASHCLIETYSTVTRLPGKYRASAEQATLYIESLLEKLQPVALTAEEYSLALKRYAASGVVGGAIYDAMIARCALKCSADILLTWNRRDFTRFGPDIERLVKTPLELGQMP
jgi:predicted nucleic acid-binding protein